MIKKTGLWTLLAALLLTVFACTPEAKVQPAGIVFSAMLEQVPFEELTVLDAERLAILLDVEEALLLNAAVGLDSSRYTPEAMIIINAAGQEELGRITQALTAYRQLLLDEYRDYRPQEMFKIEDAKVHVHGLQAVLLIVKDAKQAEEALKQIQAQ